MSIKGFSCPVCVAVVVCGWTCMGLAASLSISGDYAVAAGGEAYDSVIISANATLTGGRLTINDGGELAVEAGSATLDNAGVTFGQTAGGEVELNVASGATLRVPTAISGPASITIGRPGTVYFSGDNDFTGLLSITGGFFHAASDTAFGTTDSRTYFRSVGKPETAVIYFDGIDTSEEFQDDFDENAGTYRHYVFSAGTTNILRGNLVRKAGRCHCDFQADTRTAFLGTLTANYWDNICDGSALVVFSNTVSAARYNFSKGVFEYHSRVANFTSGHYGVQINDATLRMFATNVFASSDTATEAYTGACIRPSKTGTLDLNGYDQRFHSVYGTANALVSSAIPAVLHLDAKKPPISYNVYADDMSISLVFTGAVTLSVEGTVPVTMTAASTSTGVLDVAVADADVTLAGTAQWFGPARVVSGAKLTLEGQNVLTENSDLTIESGGEVSIPSAISVPVKSITVNGTTYSAAGTYGSRDSGASNPIDEITGSGMVYIGAAPGKTCTWNVPDGAADVKMSTVANWTEAPDCSQGQDDAVFSQSGAVAEVDEAVVFRSVTLSRPDGGSFTFADGGGSLSISSGGLSAGAATNPDLVAARTFTNEVPIALTASQTWNLPTNTVFVQKGAVSSSSGVGFLKTGGGNLHFMESSPGWQGPLTVCPASGEIHLWADGALGAGDVTLQSWYSVYAADTCLCLHGVRVPNKIMLCNEVGNGGDAVRFRTHEDTTNEFSGQVTCLASAGIIRPVLGKRSRTVFSGGMSMVQNWRSGSCQGATLVFTNTACTGFPPFNTSAGYNASEPFEMDIFTTGNVMETGFDNGFCIVGNFHLRLHAANAFAARANGTYPTFFFKAHRLSPRIDLCGTDQRIGALYDIGNPEQEAIGFTGTGVVSSVEGAQLHVWQRDGSGTLVSCALTNVVFEGGAGVTLEEGTLSFVGVPSSTTGRVEVAGGRLTLKASWANASVATVRGGTLALAASDVLGRQTDVRLNTGGSLDLADGTVQTVRWLYVDNVRKPVGRYTRNVSAVSGLLTGDGEIVSLGDGTGTVLILR